MTSRGQTMEESPRKRSRGGGHAMLPLWELANDIKGGTLCKICEPDKIEGDWKKLKNRVCLLEASVSGRFTKATHLVSTIVDNSEDQWLLQVWNQSGEKDGKAELENADDIWLLPDVGEIVSLKKGDVLIKEYSLTALSVEYEFVDAPAAVEPRKKPRKPTKKALDKASSDNIEESTGEFTLSRVL